MLRTVDGHRGELNEVNLVTALHRCARLTRRSRTARTLQRDPVFAWLLEELQPRLGELGAMGLANAAWSTATLQLGVHAQGKGDQGGWASEERGSSERSSVASGWTESVAAALAKADATKFKEQELCSALWALGKLDMGGSDAFPVLVKEVWLRLDKLQPNQLAFLMLALADARVHIPELMDDILALLAGGGGESAGACDGSQTKSPEVVDWAPLLELHRSSAVSVLFALARLRHTAPEASSMVAKLMVGELRAPDAPSPAAGGGGHDRHARAARGRGQARAGGRGRGRGSHQQAGRDGGAGRSMGVSHLAHGQVGSCAWAAGSIARDRFADGGSVASLQSELQLLKALCARTAGESQRLRPALLANVAHGSGMALMSSAPLLDRVERDALSLHEEGQLQAGDWAHVAWAFASLQHPAPRFFDALEAQLAHRPFLSTCNAYSVTLCAWALVASGRYSAEVFRCVRARVAELRGLFSPEALCMLYQLELGLRSTSGCSVASGVDVSGRSGAEVLSLLETQGRLRRRARDAWRLGREGKTPTVSALQKEVHAVARALFKAIGEKDVVLEHQAEEYSIDVAVPRRRIAIEVDGPSHFVRDAHSSKQWLSGPTVLKHTILRNAGWYVVSVGHREWEGARSGADRCELLANLLGSALTEPPVVPDLADISGVKEILPASAAAADAAKRAAAAKLLKQDALKRAIARRRR